MSITDKPLWRDYSRWQGKVLYEKVANKPVHGIISRSGVGWEYADAWFPRNWRMSGEIDVYRASYHVLVPGWSKMKQLDNWYTANPEIDIIPRVIDAEVNWNGVANSRIANFYWDVLQEIKRRDGVYPWIYSRADLINKWFAPFWEEEQLNSIHWIIADYGNDRSVEEPLDEDDWPELIDRDRIILHQTADEKPGWVDEAESDTVDWSRWLLGDADQMNAWIQERYGQPQPKYTQEEVDAMLAEREAELKAECDDRIVVERKNAHNTAVRKAVHVVKELELE